MSTPSINMSNLGVRADIHAQNRFYQCLIAVLTGDFSSYQFFSSFFFFCPSRSLFGPLVNQGCFQLSRTDKVKLEGRFVFVFIYKNMICYMVSNINIKWCRTVEDL